MVSKKLFHPSSYKHPKTVIAIMVTVVVLAVLELTGTTYLLHKRPVTKTITSTPVQTAPKTSQTTNQRSSQTTPTNQDTKVVSNAGPSSASVGSNSGSLLAPYGTFVSNHFPGKNGTTTSENSTCQTTPFANCYIEFVQGAISKTLATQKTDGSGDTSWDWDVKQAGLTSGSWKITAVATVNGQTKTTDDPVALEVQ